MEQITQYINKKLVKMFFYGVLATARVLGISANEEQQLKEFGASTLKGINIITPIVVIVTLGEDKAVADSLGSLTKEEIKTQVELVLRKSGIEVGWGEKLYIYVESNKFDIPLTDGDTMPLYAVSVSTELHQKVFLSRDNNIQTEVKTWPRTPFVVGRGIRFASKPLLKSVLKEMIEDQMEVFCNDYLAANPKEPAENEQKNK